VVTTPPEAGATTATPATGERTAVVASAVAEARRHGCGDSEAELVSAYVADVPDDELIARGSVDVCGLVLSHRDLARRRPPGEALVRVFTPDVSTDGWTTGHAVVQVVTDDMPFLVSSTTNEISRVGRGIHLVVHPRVVVVRDAAGSLLDVVGTVRGEDGHDVPEGALVESWMHVEVDRSDSEEADQALAASLRRVLGDVRAAVQDHRAMRERAETLADEVSHEHPPGVDRDDLAEAARLLRWLAEGHFTFLGYREYQLGDGDVFPRAVLRSVPGTGLGILRDGPGRGPRVTVLGERLAARARQPTVLNLTKANSRATVHRSGYLDYIGVKAFDATGRVVGERRFLGLLSSAAYTQSVLRVPVVDRKVAAVLAASGHGPRTHSGRQLLSILETYPRDELFASDAETLARIAIGVQQLQERRRTRMFVRADDFGRFVSCLIYLPRDRYTTQVRLAIQEVLTEAFDAIGIEHSSLVSESVLARLHFIVRLRPTDESAGVDLDRVDLEEIERRVAACTRTWEEDLADGLRAELGEAEGVRMARRWGPAIPEAYKEDIEPRVGVGDLVRLEALEAGHGAAPDLDIVLYHPLGAAEDESRLKLFRHRPLSLSALLPYFENLGVEVVDQRPYHLEDVGRHDDGAPSHDSFWVHDLGIRLPLVAVDPGTTTDIGRLAARFADAFVAAWTGTTESDRYDRLVLRAGLTWRQVAVLRTYGRYLRQTGTSFSADYIAEVLAVSPEVARLLVNVFETRFHPQRFAAGPDGRPSTARVAAQQRAADAVIEALDDVADLTHDRLLRSLLDCVVATLRTTYYRPGPDGRPDPTIAVKLEPARIPATPHPRPAFEIWVCGPRVEGVHLRFGPVARGGLRWSDRREDFRTEILGLVKAQQVKNALIVPTGAKGGFVAKRLPDPTADRDAWYAEGVQAYRTFVSALLDLTDDRDLTAGPQAPAVPPPSVVRHDGDDPYLVVAADKGTAAMSDVANDISTSRGFWLGDAFASGGSKGYDHKAMGITARGAWESVRRHFLELGLDVDRDSFTVAGIGDMSGDVFGNGMLLSPGIRLVAAFDHRNVFLDPDPDPVRSSAERRRLFALPRSSWDDYDRAAISPGGGIVRRDAKSVQVAAPAARILGLDPGSDGTPLVLSPADLVRAILEAPVDLLWNGGIGTFVKASDESHAEVGDKVNDAVRVDATRLRCRVVGEGGNLGLTQRARVEAALAGVRLNTDAIDNSAGVDCSDHEVNIKILLDRVVADGDLTWKQRDQLLLDMTDDVAAAVLRHNIDQNTMLGTARHHAAPMVSVHRRLLRWLSDTTGLDRDLEALPDDAGMEARQAEGNGLVGPELAVASAYAKLSLTAALLGCSVPDEAWTERFLVGYFPGELRDRYPARIRTHPLRREIVATRLANRVIDTVGITFVFRLADELSTPADRSTRAWAVAAGVFDLEGWLASVVALSGQVAVPVLDDLRLANRRVIDRTARWLLQSRPDPLDVDAEIARFRPTVEALGPRLWELLRAAGREIPADDLARLLAAGVPPTLARRSLEILDEFALLDVTEIAGRTGEAASSVLEVYVQVIERYEIDPILLRITSLPRGDRWQALARAALRYDVYAAAESLTRVVVETVPLGTVPGDDASARLELWERDNSAGIARARHMLHEIRALATDDVAPLLVALRSLRSVVRSGSAEEAR
jgi:glutamate dehydrogenase